MRSLLCFVLTAMAMIAATSSAVNASPFSFGQDPAASFGMGQERATLHAEANFESVEPGQQVVVALVLEVADGWHAQSNAPLDENLIAFRITAEAGENATVYAPQYAEPTIENYPLVSPETGGDMSVFSHRTVHYLPVEIGADASGEVTLTGKATLQICDDSSCLPPQDLDWSVTLPVGSPVAKASEDFAGFDPATWATLKPIDNAAAETAAAGNGDGMTFSLFGWELNLAETPVLVVLLMAFVAGIFFNVVPCVLPVLPLKIISFYEAAQHSRAKSFAHGVAFSAGIVLMFAILSLLIVAGDTLLSTGNLAWGELFSKPWFAATVTLVLVAAALYQFGIFSIMLPSKVYEAEQQATTAGGGSGAVLGNVAAGSFTAILSTPCTFGLFAAVLVWALAQPTWLGVLSIITVGVGMASPYLVLSAFPGVAKALPASGKWSEVIKQATGFILLGVAVYFVKPLLPDAWRSPQLWWLIWASLLACGLYLVAASIRYKQGLLVTAIVTLVLAGGTLPLAYGFANPPVGWTKFKSDAPAELADARASGGPVVVKFTADWCANCQTVERFVYGSQDKLDALTDDGVTLLKADLTRSDAAGWDLLEKLNPARAIPFTAVYLPGRDEPIPLVGIYSEDDLQAALAQE